MDLVNQEALHALCPLDGRRGCGRCAGVLAATLPGPGSEGEESWPGRGAGPWAGESLWGRLHGSQGGRFQKEGWGIATRPEGQGWGPNLTVLLWPVLEMEEGMDRRVIQAMQLLRKAGRLDLLVENDARRDRPVWRAESGVAAAVAACSPPRRIRVRSAPQGERSGSEDGDPGELLTGSAPWEEEKAGPVRLAGLHLNALTGRCGPRQVQGDARLDRVLHPPVGW
ncbi:hypothetical protein NDU88_004285 [Pleurodeles waltl]|uniref:Uncharacterized protein n=1 Tax=Pleurodeles waltl TaxID=8319 RepID=A0AAV7PKJ8_PLEWA|nr:hypothetical protein NDU88_004285 [Pleurodeles waltl]